MSALTTTPFSNMSKVDREVISTYEVLDMIFFVKDIVKLLDVSLTAYYDFVNAYKNKEVLRNVVYKALFKYYTLDKSGKIYIDIDDIKRELVKLNG